MRELLEARRSDRLCRKKQVYSKTFKAPEKACPLAWSHPYCAQQCIWSALGLIEGKFLYMEPIRDSLMEKAKDKA